MKRRKGAERLPPEQEPRLAIPAADGLTWVSLDQVHPGELTWLWAPRLATGSPFLIEGRKGEGKSSIAAAIAAAVTGGPALPGCRRRKPAGVLWMPGEDPVRTVVRPRLEVAGAKIERVIIPGADEQGLWKQRPTLPSCLQEFEELAARCTCRLLVIDPIGAWCDPGVSIESDEGARMVMTSLADWALRTDACVLASRNFTKGSKGHALDQGRGSGTLGDHARGILRCDPHPDQLGAHILSHVRTNLGDLAASLVYMTQKRDNSVHVAWGGVSDLSADQLAEGGGSPADLDERLDARRLLRRAIGGKWRSAREVQAEAIAAGVSLGSLRRAKAELHVQSRRVGGLASAGSWEWGPPLNGWPKGM